MHLSGRLEPQAENTKLWYRQVNLVRAAATPPRGELVAGDTPEDWKVMGIRDGRKAGSLPAFIRAGTAILYLYFSAQIRSQGSAGNLNQHH
ncbi:MAG: hypothetical protein ACLPPF_16385 [Rhodomicrobium sp.]